MLLGGGLVYSAMKDVQSELRRGVKTERRWEKDSIYNNPVLNQRLLQNQCVKRRFYFCYGETVRGGIEVVLSLVVYGDYDCCRLSVVFPSRLHGTRVCGGDVSVHSSLVIKYIMIDLLVDTEEREL
jgi:hypothetical protein